MCQCPKVIRGMRIPGRGVSSELRLFTRIDIRKEHLYFIFFFDYFLSNSYDNEQCQEESHCIVILKLEVDSNSEESKAVAQLPKFLYRMIEGLRATTTIC